MAMRRLAAMAAMFWMLALLGLGCERSSCPIVDGDLPSGDGDDESVASREIGPEGGEIAFEDAALVIPEGALEESVVITIRESNARAEGFEAVGPVFAFGPSGLTFKKKITVILPYYRDLAAGRDLAGFWTSVDDSDVWEDLGGESAEPGRWRFETTHFSLGVIGTTEISDGDEDGDADGDETDAEGPALRFDEGASWSVTYADDIGDGEGVQIAVSLTARDIPEETVVALRVGDAEAIEAAVDADGKVEFESVTIQPGENQLLAEAEIGEGEIVRAEATVTLVGCQLVFVSPTTGFSLSDAGGDCAQTCGDDLDCTRPNLQYDVVLAMENVGAGTDVTLSVNGVDYLADAGLTEVRFEAIGLPDGEQVTLAASATVEGVACETSATISVEVQCDCHMTIDPVPEDYNLSSIDDDPNLEGLQKTFTVSSDNCPADSQVTMQLDEEEPRTLPLGEDQSVDFTLTLADNEHSLEATVAEAGGNRAGVAGPYSFFVDYTAPTFASTFPEDGGALTKIDDADYFLGNGITFTLTGATSEPTGPVTLTINGEPWEEQATVDNLNFTFENVTITRPARAVTPVPFTFAFFAVDEKGNEGSSSVAVTAYFDEPSITIVQIGGKAVSDDLRLGVADDLDPATDLLQTTVLAETNFVSAGMTAILRRASGDSYSSQVGEDGTVSWSVALPYGERRLTASTTPIEGGSAVESLPVIFWVDWTAPDVDFVAPLEGDWFNAGPIAVQVFSDDAEEGQYVNLLIDDEPTADAVQLNADGVALFASVALPAFTAPTTFELKALLNDYAGNPGGKTIQLNFDNVAPSVSIVAPASPIENNLNIQLDVLAAGETDGRLVHLELFSLDDLENPLFSDDAALLGGTASRIYSFLADGDYRAVAAYEDEAGNTGSDTEDFTVDTGCYTGSLTFPGGNFFDNKYWYGQEDATGGVVTINVGFATGAPDPAPNGTQVQLFLNGSGTPSATATVSGGAATLTGVVLADGENTIEVSTLKFPGPQQCYASPRPARLVVDLTPPVLTLASPAPPVPPTDPLRYNAQSTDASGSAGFQTAFTYHIDGAVTGRPVTLVVSGSGFDSAEYMVNGDANGDALFSAVTLSGGPEAIPEGATLTLTATVVDRAGNMSAPLAYTVLVDRTVPTFRDFAPPEGTLTQINDANPNVAGLQLALTFFIDGGAPGADNVFVTVTPDAAPQTPYDLGPYDLAANGSVSVTDTLEEGGWSFAFSHTDAFGNEGQTQVHYSVDFSASVSLSDASGNLLDGLQNLVWNKTKDLQPDTAGFQVGFRANTFGLEAGTLVSLCSDQGRQDGTEPYGRCTQYPSYIVVDRKQVAISSGETGTAVFSSVSLKDNATHYLYAEAEDASANFDYSDPARIALDSVSPAAPTIAVDSNTDLTNDAGGNIVLNATEAGAGGAATFFVGSSDADATRITFYVPSLPAASQTISDVPGHGRGALFTNVALGNGFENQVEAEASDAEGNVSTRAAVSLVVDTVGPQVAFDDPDDTPLYQADCGGVGVNQDPCLTTIGLTISEGAGEAFDLTGGAVTLTAAGRKGQSTQTIPSYSGGSVPITFNGFAIAQGSQDASVLVKDPAGNSATVINTFLVDSLAPTPALTTPDPGSAFPLTYEDADDNLPGGCGGNGTFDGQLTRCEWAGQVTGLEEGTLIELQYGASAGGPFVTFGDAAASQLLNGAPESQNLTFQPLNFGQGTFYVRLRATESGTGNVRTTTTYQVTVNLAGKYMTFEMNLDDTALGSGRKLGIAYDIVGAPPEYRTEVTIRTNLDDGLVPTLSVNGSALPVSSALNGTGQVQSGQVTYRLNLNVAPATNTLSAVYTPDVGDPVSWQVTGVMADKVRPTISWTYPTGALYLAAINDADGTPDGFMQLASNVHLTSADTDLSSQTVTLKGINSGTGVSHPNIAQATWSGTAVQFPSVRLPNGAYYTYIDGLVDDYGNTLAPFSNPLRYIVADDDPPGALADLAACLGENTGAGGYQTDAAICANYETCGNDAADAGEECGETGLPACPVGQHCADCACVPNLAVCGNGAANAGEECGEPTLSACPDGWHCADCTCVTAFHRANRRKGDVLLAWTVPNADGATGAGSGVTDYELRYKLGTGATPCGGVTWNTASAIPSGGITATIDTPRSGLGEAQAALVQGFDVNTNTSICFLVRAKDSINNYSQSQTQREVVLRKTAVAAAQLDTPDSGTFADRLAWGDFNDDGFADLAVADYLRDGSDGAVLVYEGGKLPSGAADLALNGANGSGEFFGVGLAAGDVNNDQIDDLVVGAYASGGFDGAAYIFFGAAGTGLPTTPNVTFQGGGAFQALGGHVEVFDYNDDGIGDVFIGTDWATADDLPIYMYRGRSSWNAAYTPSGGGADLTLRRYAAAESPFASGDFGFYMGHGDMDGDGVQDLLIADNDYEGTTNDRFFVLWGAPNLCGDPWVACTKWAKDSGGVTDPAFALVANQDSSGQDDFIVGFGDANNDGLDELMVHRSVTAAVIHYRSTTATPRAIATSGFVYQSGTDNSYGLEPQSAGDFDLDGYNDAVLAGQGVARIFWGGSGNLTPNTSLSIATLPAAPNALAAIGGTDYDADGKPDIIVINNTTGDLYLIH
ncbi:MAG: hypothetical protein C4523_14910 [Myxococcales bacterium]|nr:MAG: hypothetical protein C4523_14910 [Myxococcales bacterium]